MHKWKAAIIVSSLFSLGLYSLNKNINEPMNVSEIKNSMGVLYNKFSISQKQLPEHVEPTPVVWQYGLKLDNVTATKYMQNNRLVVGFRFNDMIDDCRKSVLELLHVYRGEFIQYASMQEVVVWFKEENDLPISIAESRVDKTLLIVMPILEDVNDDCATKGSVDIQKYINAAYKNMQN